MSDRRILGLDVGTSGCKAIVFDDRWNIITTSRRTPKKIENLLQREFKRHPACRLLIIASSNNVPEAMGGILGVSDLVIVSGDSISMVAEQL